MNKKKNIKINQSINIIESFALILLLTISLFSYSNIIIIPSVVKTIITIISLLLIVTILSIEMFCLMLESNKYRIISIAYYVLLIISLLSINLLIPFYSLILVLVSNLAKNYFRIKNISTIYEYDHFAAYCKIYGIKTRKPRKKGVTKVTKTVTKRVTVKSTNKTATKKTSKSYA